MPVEYLVSKQYIPDDGSVKIIEDFVNSVEDSSFSASIFPDVHYKAGSSVVNGMLTASETAFFPAMLGVENCGFSFGTLKEGREGASTLTRERVLEAFDLLSRTLKAYSLEPQISKEETRGRFEAYFRQNISEFRFYKDALECRTDEELVAAFLECFNDNLQHLAACSIGTLGGGNHFLEVQQIVESMDPELDEGSLVFIIHSDSIAVGEHILLMFSNLSELDYLPPWRRIRAKVSWRLKQLRELCVRRGLWREPVLLYTLLFGNRPGRAIPIDSQVGKTVLKFFLLASAFGHLNRASIASQFSEALTEVCGASIGHFMGSMSHDSLSLEDREGVKVCIQRNGVQHLKEASHYVLPGALGTESFIMKNTSSVRAYYSANHGVGRVLDKHLARGKFNEEETIEKIEASGMSLFRIGAGNIAEQDFDSFKDVSSIVSEMEQQHLGIKAAKMRPIASIKG